MHNDREVARVNEQPMVRMDLLSYQPICDPRQRVVGVEMISRQGSTDGGEYFAPPAAESVSAILNAFIYAGMDELFRNRKVFVKVSDTFLMNEVVQLLPKERVVFELVPCQEVSGEFVQRVARLHQSGFSIALDRWKPADSRTPLLPYVVIAKVDMADPAAARLAARELKGSPAQLLAAHVDDAERQELALALGASLLQGQFFQKEQQAQRRSPAASMQTVLELIAELNSDGPDRKLEDFFKENPGLQLQLLHMVNSAATGFNISITSIKQAIAVLGRTQILRWLQVLLYTLDEGVSCPSVLMQSALWRAGFMESLSKHYVHKMGSAMGDMAFITGTLSLSGALLGEPLEQVLDKIRISGNIREALLHREGVLGSMLSLAEALEEADFERAETSAKELKFGIDFVMSCQNSSLAWANKITCH